MGLGPWAMVVMMVVLAVAIIGVFVGLWRHDRNRSDGVSGDPSRQRTDRRTRR